MLCRFIYKSHLIFFGLSFQLCGFLLVESLYQKMKRLFCQKSILENNFFCMEELLVHFYLSTTIIIRGLYGPFFSILAFIVRILLMPITKQLPQIWNKIYFGLLISLLVYFSSSSHFWEFIAAHFQQTFCFSDSNINFFVSFGVVGPILSALSTVLN